MKGGIKKMPRGRPLGSKNKVKTDKKEEPKEEEPEEAPLISA